MIRDQRIKNYHDLLHDLENERDKSLFSKHQYAKINEVINFLKNELEKKITSKESDPKILFEKSIDGCIISDLLTQGDDFYCLVFESEKLIEESNQDLQKSNPLTIAVNELYNSIWDMSNSSESSVLAVYGKLKKRIEQLLAKAIASESHYCTFTDWIKIIDSTDGMWGSYNEWISNIAPKLIANNIDELLFIAPSLQLHELAESAGHLNEKEKVSKAYENRLTTVADKSDWEFIKTVTDQSGLFLLNEDLRLKEDLLLRFELKSWLLWVDNLKWPILQDNAFYSIQDLVSMEEVIALLLQKDVKFNTKSEYLLLIALQNYYRLIEKITLNLYDLKEGQWHYNDTIIKQTIVDASINAFDKWITLELEESCKRLFELIFEGKPVSESKKFTGVFEWINSYSKQQYGNNKYSELRLKFLNVLNESFEKLLIQDSGIKIKFTKEITIEKINWQVFEKLIKVFENEKSDSLFGDFLYEKYAQYIESDNFTWNIELLYNDVFINQAYHLSYLMTKLPDTMKRWSGLFKQFKCWSEGWDTANNYDYKARRKEIFVLMAGVCLSYSYYQQKNSKKAKEVFDEISEIVISQYRTASSYHSVDYKVVMKLLAHVLGHFSPADADSFVALLDKKCDDIQFFLAVVYEITVFIPKETLTLDALSKRLIKDQIDKNFWKIEYGNSEFALKGKLAEFSNLKNEVLKNIN
ncbi:hypothetical protein [Flavobacterium sp. 245]|uniref:hypothetical protein n=1 Tax=Flavobacterium sp. 245 TaxID=2512115 RepID=UPI001060C882|nr:hypothetical protein [Flavobacterium sp. 245]TDO96072.1 hypothetical protein EV145_11245 [Flavobacterium sp. 245]